MHVTLDRSPVKLLRLADDEAAAERVPPILSAAHKSIGERANAAVAEAARVIADANLSEVGKRKKLTALANNAIGEIQKLGAVADQIDAGTNEAEGAALRQALGKFDGARLLSIASMLSQRSREQRMSAVMRARTGDRETLAAIISAPVEFGILDGVDHRMVAALRDQLLDESLRQRCDAVRFATARYRHSLTGAVETLRRLTNTEEPPSSRIRRVG